MTATKRAFDLLLALALLPVLLPLMLVVGAAILIADGRPVLYRSERMRSPDRAFTLLKFRTMRGADDGRGVTGGDKAARITPLGAFLRKKRLDELPQLFNIFAGDMSFVGPRPPLRRYVEARPDLYAVVLLSRPGVTGLATVVYSRHEEWLLARCETAEATDRTYRCRCIPAKARLDLIYQRHRSVCMDAKIIAMTLGAVFWRQ